MLLIQTVLVSIFARRIRSTDFSEHRNTTKPLTLCCSNISIIRSSRSLSQLLLQRNTVYPAAKAASSRPRATSGKTGLVMSGTIKPMVVVLRMTSPRATAFGLYPICLAILMMRSRVSSLTYGWPLSARDTVAYDTPHFSAISLIVGFIAPYPLTSPYLNRGRSRPNNPSLNTLTLSHHDARRNRRTITAPQSVVTSPRCLAAQVVSSYRSKRRSSPDAPGTRLCEG